MCASKTDEIFIDLRAQSRPQWPLPLRMLLSLKQPTACRVSSAFCMMLCRRRWACERSGKFMLIWSVGELFTVCARVCVARVITSIARLVHGVDHQQLVQRVAVPYGHAVSRSCSTEWTQQRIAIALSITALIVICTVNIEHDRYYNSHLLKTVFDKCRV